MTRWVAAVSRGWRACFRVRL